MTKTMGPYDSRNNAMRANCQRSMKGNYAGGRLLKIDGELVYSLAVRPYTADGVWFAEVDFRSATEEEKRAAQIAALKQELAKRHMAWSDDPTDTVAIANRAGVARLKAELAALEAEHAAV